MATSLSADQKHKFTNGFGAQVAFEEDLGSILDDALSTDPGDISLTDGDIFVGNGSGVAAGVTPSGAVAITNAGVTSLEGFAHATDGLERIMKVATVTYDFSVDGSGTSLDLGVTIPDNSVILNVVEEIITDLNSTSGTTTFKIGLPTDGDLTANVTADNSNAGLAVGVPDFATAGDWVKTTGARAVTATVSVDDLTAGKARWYISYLASE